MAEHTEDGRPSFDSDDSSLLRLHVLREGIYEHPETYLSALALMEPGRSDTGRPVPAAAVTSAMTQLEALMKTRDDLKIRYDPETDRAIEGNLVITGLIRELHSDKARSARVKGRAQAPHNPFAELTRDRIRLLTIGTYVGRVAAWKRASQQADSGSMDGPVVSSVS